MSSINVVTHNMSAMFSGRQLGITETKKKKATEKLSSGYKINRAADDAAGLTISEKMRRNIRGLNQASKNIQDGISLLQVADGALTEDHAILQRMNELAVQAANGTNTVADRAAIQAEIKDLIVEVDRIANSTTFNDKIYPLNHGDLNDIYPNNRIMETIDLSVITDGVYNGYTYYGGNITITDEGKYTIKNALAWTHNSLDIAADATICLETTISRIGSGSCITVENGVNAVIQINGKLTYNLNDPRHPISGLFSTVGTDTWYGNDQTSSIELKDNSTITLMRSKDSPNDSCVFECFNNYKGVFLCGNNVTINIDGVDLWNHQWALWANEDSSFGNTLNVYNNSKIEALGAFNNGYWSMDEVNLWSCNFTISQTEGYPLKKGEGEKAYNSINVLDNQTEYYSRLQSYENGDYFVFMYDGCKESFDYENSDEGPESFIHSGKTNDEIWIQAGDDADEGMIIHTVDARAEALGISKVNVASESGARNAIDTVKAAIYKVSTYRSYFGAMQNRLEHAMAIDDNAAENTQAAESQIRDTDMAAEIVKYAKESILEQVGHSVLAQANQSTQGVLSLLQ